MAAFLLLPPHGQKQLWTVLKSQKKVRILPPTLIPSPPCSAACLFPFLIFPALPPPPATALGVSRATVQLQLSCMGSGLSFGQWQPVGKCVPPPWLVPQGVSCHIRNRHREEEPAQTQLLLLLSQPKPSYHAANLEPLWGSPCPQDSGDSHSKLRWWVNGRGGDMPLSKEGQRG